MTISLYHVDSVIKAYNKHIKSKSGGMSKKETDDASCYRDHVTISNSPVDKEATFERISYNIRDLIVKSAEE